MTQMCCEAVRPSSEQWCQIERIAALTPCRRGFACLSSGFETMGRLEIPGSDGAMECLEPEAQECNLGVRFHGGTHCACLLRLYMAQKFNL